LPKLEGWHDFYGVVGSGVIDFAARHRLPAKYGLREFVEAGGLLSYGTHLADLSRRGAHYADEVIQRPRCLPHKVCIDYV
jgi:hypothetical protein